MKCTFRTRATQLLAPLLSALLLAAPCWADKPLILVTPAGVYQSIPKNGIPGPWVPLEVDVIVQGFHGPGSPIPGPPPVDLPPTDTETKAVSALTKSLLANKDEATAVAAIVDALAKAGLRGLPLREALTLTSKLADSELKADGRIIKWASQATAITTDPAKLTAGARDAFGISAAVLQTIQSEIAKEAGAEVSAEAVDLVKIIQIVQMILELLTKLGVI